MGSGACAHDSHSWSRAALETASRRNTDAQGLVLTPSRNGESRTGAKGKRGPKVVRRRSGAPFGEAGRSQGWSPASSEQASRVRHTALCSLTWRESEKEPLLRGAETENQDRARADFRSENNGARPRAGLFEKWIWNGARSVRCSHSASS